MSPNYHRRNPFRKIRELYTGQNLGDSKKRKTHPWMQIQGNQCRELSFGHQAAWETLMGKALCDQVSSREEGRSNQKWTVAHNGARCPPEGGDALHAEGVWAPGRGLRDGGGSGSRGGGAGAAGGARGAGGARAVRVEERTQGGAGTEPGGFPGRPALHAEHTDTDALVQEGGARQPPVPPHVNGGDPFERRWGIRVPTPIPSCKPPVYRVS